MTLTELIDAAEQRLLQAGVAFGHGTDNPWDEAALLLAHSLDMARITENLLPLRMTSSEAKVFCDLLLQRIEQRIGRCHRYGHKFDVVVVNFLNNTNAADQRVYQLLDEKFQLFNGVFGASDEVLGAIESGVDFEIWIRTCCITL